MRRPVDVKAHFLFLLSVSLFLIQPSNSRERAVASPSFIGVIKRTKDPSVRMREMASGDHPELARIFAGKSLGHGSDLPQEGSPPKFSAHKP